MSSADVGMQAGAWATPGNVARCPRHRKPAFALPQSLLFDENYDSHAFYENDKACPCSVYTMLCVAR